MVNTIQSLTGGKFNIVYDKSLVRGMGYYTGMVFEVVSTKFGLLLPAAADMTKMIGKFLGETVPAVGFSIGFERICEILKDSETVNVPQGRKIVLVYADSDDFGAVLKKTAELRADGWTVNMLKRSKKLGKQLDAMIDNGYSHSFNFGESTEPKELQKK